MELGGSQKIVNLHATSTPNQTTICNPQVLLHQMQTQPAAKNNRENFPEVML